MSQNKRVAVEPPHHLVRQSGHSSRIVPKQQKSMAKPKILVSERPHQHRYRQASMPVRLNEIAQDIFASRL